MRTLSEPGRLPLNRRAAVAVATVVLCLGLAACAPAAPATNDASDANGAGQPAASAPADSATTSADESASANQPAEPGAYVSDEQCLSCHGGSYEALAETTAQYGLSNPHDSIHGGPNACVNCHARDKEITDNQCTHCHDWPHNPESGLGA